MSDKTHLGVQFWEWEAMNALPSHARLLWLALYTSSNAKRSLPGLYLGSIRVMAEDSHLSPDEVRDGLDKLLTAEPPLVEFDQKLKLLRFCEFPDAHDAAHNGRALRGWWNKFRSIPPCELRDAHVRTLRWLLERNAAARGESVNADVEKVWSDTFAKIPLPAPRRRGVRSLADSDTSTAVQPSLFPCRVPVVATSVPGPLADDLDVVEPSRIPSPYPSPSPSAFPKAASSASPSENMKFNDSAGPDTLSIPMDTDTDADTEIRSSSSPDPDLSSTPRASTGPPRLALVPDCYLASPDELLAVFPCVTKQWRQLGDLDRGRVRLALVEVLASARASGHAAEDLAMAGRWVGVRADDVEVVEVPEIQQLGDLAWLERAITLGREHERIRAAKLEALQQSRESLGFA